MQTDIQILQKYQLKRLELNALLEVTEAINNNVSEDDLFKIYYFTLRANKQYPKFALFIGRPNGWECIVSHGVSHKLKGNGWLFKVSPEDEELPADAIPASLTSFERNVLIRHKDQLLAVLFYTLDERIGSEEEDAEEFIQALSNIVLVAVENKKLARRELQQEAFRKELQIAGQVQQNLLPKELPNTEVLESAASYMPHQLIGGDFYDLISLDSGKFLFCIADVSGKGTPAALLMANFQASLRTLVRQTEKLEVIITELNRQIGENGKGESFITAFLALYDPEQKQLQYVNAGHNPPLLWQPTDNQPIELLSGCTLLGIFPSLPSLKIGKLEALKEFTLFAYTDGLTETFRADNEPYGEERLHALLEKNATLSLEELHSQIFAALDDFREELSFSDDITMLSCRYHYKAEEN